ncbi:DUF647-domain-containing protein [Panus rudis PR-1116 ss-1]|nr:DUF647-domain-containing protein [Panus rudis PR-1116 ss-1]
MTAYRILEKDESGRASATFIVSSEDASISNDARSSSETRDHHQLVGWRGFLRDIFLPAGYPATVSPDYLQCQIYYGIQAFCSSLAGLLASRAVLEGHGIGKADASATDAMLLTVIQDAFTRLATILSAYYLGTSLYPEAKTYRLVADIANDVAIVTDILSPHLSAYALSSSYPYVLPQSGTALRTAALCLSGAFRALCGVAAGGSRAALTLHFAQDGHVPGDVGDLSAKDASKETVLALIGMLAGSWILPHLHSTQATHAVVFLLLFGHLLANYIAVRVVVMRSLSKQRAGILWSAYHSQPLAEKPSHRILSPAEVAAREHLFGRENALLDSSSHSCRIAGYATIGSPVSSILPPQNSIFRREFFSRLRKSSWLSELLSIFSQERYIVWFDFSSSPLSCKPRFHILLKEGHTAEDHLKAWVFASDLATACSRSGSVYERTPAELIQEVKMQMQLFDERFRGFVDALKSAGWDVDVPGLVSGSPKTVIIEGVAPEELSEDKKNI